MAGIEIKEVKTTEVRTTDGKKLQEGDLILIGVKGQDVICKFREMSDAGYFVTDPVVTSLKPVQYRPASITSCFKVASFEVDVDEGLQGAAKAVATEADAGALAPASGEPDLDTVNNNMAGALAPAAE